MSALGHDIDQALDQRAAMLEAALAIARQVDARVKVGLPLDGDDELTARLVDYRTARSAYLGEPMEG